MNKISCIDEIFKWNVNKTELDTKKENKKELIAWTLKIFLWLRMHAMQMHCTSLTNLHK